jgi:hypothetical protein
MPMQDIEDMEDSFSAFFIGFLMPCPEILSTIMIYINKIYFKKRQ